MALIIFSTIFFFLSVRTPVASMVTTACRRGRSRRRLAILSDGNAAGLVHSSKFSCKSSNLRRFEVLFTLRSKTRQRLGCHNAHLANRKRAEGQIIATLEDYAGVRDVVTNFLTDGVETKTSMNGMRNDHDRSVYEGEDEP